MKVKMLAVVAVTAALSFSMAGMAAASPLGQPKHHKPKPKHTAITQVSGKKLATALLPGSAFGVGYTKSGEVDTGGGLLSSHVTQGASSIPCDDLGIFAIGQGQTAESFDQVDAPDSSSEPSLLLASQNISQFASSKAAWTFLGQEQSRFSACQSYNETTGSLGNGGLALAITIESVSKTKVGSYPAFTVAQSAELSASEGTGIFYIDTTVVQAGTNVYTIQEWNSVDGTVPGWMPSKLISQAQKLYKS
jgi:hypothetical protein